MRRPLCLAAALLCALAAAGCRRDGCVGGDDGTCLPPPPCAALAPPVCSGKPVLRVARIGDEDERVPASPKALAGRGDFVMENDQVRVVLDGPDHPHFLAPSGGAILDLAPLGGSGGDQINSIYHAAGLLPRDAVHYETAELLDSGLDPSAAGAFVAVVFRGHLEGDTRVTVVTRYELRRCEDGVRVRTDLYNGAPAPNTLYLTDGFFWGDDSLVPFVPGQGMGFLEPNLDLLNIDQAWRTWPFLAARPQSQPEIAYAVVSCDHATSSGFTSTTLSASGVPLGVTQPGDGFHFERFIAAVPTASGLAPAVAEALRVRTAVHGDAAPVTVTGRVVANGAPVDSGGSGQVASLLFYEPAFGPDPDDPSRRIPWSETVPAADGTFQVVLPPKRTYRVQPYAFGLPAGPATSFSVTGAGAGSDSGAFPIGDLSITAPAHLNVTVQSAPGVPATYAEVVIIPVADPAATGAPTPSLYDLFSGCSPMLGAPHGGAPACNRAFPLNGSLRNLALPPGQYFVYATRGPFATLDRAEVDLAPGTSAEVTLLVQSLASELLPDGVISGDFHVHGGASFDSAIPDQDRVVSFLATGVDLVVATDHNVVTTYQSTLEHLGATHALFVISGVEQTPNIPWFYVPGHEFPRTLGHFNFWPLTPDAMDSRNGAPWSELREPGQLMDDMDLVFANPDTAIRQLNHPYIAAKLGRDQGYARAIEYDPTTPIPSQPTSGASFAGNTLARTPGSGPGHHWRNDDWNVQEVMTGASRADWLRSRALWFSMLSQGLLRTGTANSDSHTLSIEQVGYPRNLIWGGHDKTALDIDAFDGDVLAGHVEGTNGPVLDVTLDDGRGTVHRPDRTAFPVAAGATLHVTVSAAPWIPVEEVRIFVNGRQLPADTVQVQQPATWDPLGGQPIRYADAQVNLSALLPGSGDAWLVVEAGMHQDTPPDTDGDGLPDLPDADVPGRPDSLGDHRFDLQAIAPGVWPAAFTNPFFIDVDGDGQWKPPGLP